jgi:hypothetical protein
MMLQTAKEDAVHFNMVLLFPLNKKAAVKSRKNNGIEYTAAS